MRQKQYLNIGDAISGRSKSGSKTSLTLPGTDALMRTAEIALVVIATAGVATIAVVAPNLFQAINSLFLKKHNKRLRVTNAKEKTANAFYYLKRSGLIKLRKNKADWNIIITNLGKKRLQRIQSTVNSIPIKTNWDGKWWLVAADIPTEHYRRNADKFRTKLKSLQFFPLQRTLWLFPHDPRAEIQTIITHYQISQFVTVMEVNRLDKEDEHKAKTFFKSRHLL